MIKGREIDSGRIVAAGAGLVGFPSAFETGWLLRRMRDKIMIQGGLFHVGGVVTAGTGFIGIPSDFRTGRRFCIMKNQIMSEGIKGLGFGVGAAGTDARLLSGGCTGRIRGLLPVSPVVTQGVFGDVFAADLVTADGAVNHLIIAAIQGAGGIDDIQTDWRRLNVMGGKDGVVSVDIGCAVIITEAFLAAGTGPVF